MDTNKSNFQTLDTSDLRLNYDHFAVCFSSAQISDVPYDVAPVKISESPASRTAIVEHL